MSDDEITSLVESGREASVHWENSSSFERSRLLSSAAQELKARKQQFINLLCSEAKKPVRFAAIEVDRAIDVLDWAAQESLRFAGNLLRLDTTATGRNGWGIVNRFPRGLILGITPFNFPLNLLIHKAAPAIASGNSILIKPSPFTPQVALAVQKLFEDVGAPKGLLQVVLASDEQTAHLTDSKLVDMISFTGSARIGWLIRKQAPQKPVTLELGGNAWCILGTDVQRKDFPRIAKRIAGAAFGYAGQSCISVQNIAIPHSYREEFLELLREETSNTSYGDPSSADVICGPVINTTAKIRIEAEIEAAKKAGAVITVSSRRIDAKEALPNIVAPHLIESAASSLGIVKEEIFGPVACTHIYENWDNILDSINQGRYGLQAGLFTQDLSLIEEAYRKLKIGGLIINDVPTTRYDHQPYGGIKDSGFGREGIASAMEEMTEPRFLALSSTLPF